MSSPLDAWTRALASIDSTTRGEVLDALALTLDASGALDPAVARRLAAAIAPDRAGEPSLPGSLARYEVRQRLGQGGMGEVHLAYDKSLEREVAIKRIRVPQRPVALRRFLDEARVTGRLEHPNIVPVHEIGVDPETGGPYLVMKRVKGRTLSEILQAIAEGRPAQLAGSSPGPEPPGRVLGQLLQVFLKVCDGVGYAHSRGILHRDLKPANIMIGEFGEVLVMDWGLAKLLDDRTALAEGGDPDTGPVPAGLTRDGEVTGTPMYMPPEQAMGRIGEIDRRSDIYSLGAVLGEMLTLCPPFDADDIPRLIGQVVRGRREPLARRSVARWSVSPELQAVVDRAMARHPERRYASVEELAAEIEAYLAGRVVQAARTSAVGRLRKWIGRHPGPSVALALVLLGLTGSLLAARAAARATRRQEEAHQAAEREAHLGALLDDLQALEEELEAIEARIASDDPRAALEASQSFADRNRERLDRLRSDDLFLRDRPGEAARAARLEPCARDLDRRAVRAWFASESRRLAPDDGQPLDAARLRDLESAFETFSAFVATPGLHDLPVAEMSRRLARAALDAGDESTAGRWVARGIALQPDAAAAGAGFLELADRIASRGDLELAAIRYHLALGAFGETSGDLEARALLGLTTCLAGLGGRAGTPFEPETPAREMALRAVLEIVDERGRPRGPVDPAVLGPARDWLAILRLSVAHADHPGASFGSSVPGGPLDLALSVRAGNLVVTGPGDAVRRRIDLAAIVREDLPGAQPRDFHARLVDLRPGASERQVVVDFLDPERPGHHLIGLASLGEPRLLFSMPLEHEIDRVWTGDVDGDGRVDLLVRYAYPTWRVRVVYQEPDGRFSRPLPLFESPDDRSVVDDLVVADLDGDGSIEVAVSFGGWQHFSVVVFRSGSDRRLRAIARRPVGVSSLTRVDRPGASPVVLLASSADRRERRFFELHDQPVPPMGLTALRFDRSDWVPLAGPTVVAPEPAIGYLRASELSPGGGRPLLALVTRFEQGTGTDWLVDGVVRRMPAAEFTGSGRQLVDKSIPGRLYRSLDDDELVEWAGDRVPRPLRRTTSDEARIARFLLDSGLAPEAIRYIDRRPPPPSLELERILIAALAEAGEFDLLGQLLTAREPSASIASDVLVALEAAARTGGRAGLAGDVLTLWSRSASLPGSVRQPMGSRGREWLETAEALASVRFDLEGRALEIEGEPVGLGEVLVSTDLLGLAPVRSGGQPALRIRPDRPRTGPVLESDGRATSALEIPFVGWPFRARGGSFSATIDLRLPDAPFGGDLNAGLALASSVLGARGGGDVFLGFAIVSGGGNGIQFTRFETRPHTRPLRIDPLVGRTIRVEMKYLAPARVLRLVLADPGRRKILDRWEIAVARPLSTEPLLLGFRGFQEVSSLEIDVTRIRVAGDLHPVRLDDLVDEALARHRDRSRALAHRIEDRPDPAVAILRDLAARHREAARTASDPGFRRSLEGRAIALAAEAAWLAAAGRPEDFVRSIGPQIAGDEQLADLLAWHLERPRDENEDARWRAVGAVVAGRRHPDREPRVLVREVVLSAIQTGAGNQEHALLMAWAHGQHAPSDRSLALELLALDQARSRTGSRERRGALTRRIVSLLETAPVASEADSLLLGSPYQGLRFQALLTLGRRADALILVEETVQDDLEAEVALQTRLQGEVEDELAKAGQRAERAGTAFVDLPGR